MTPKPKAPRSWMFMRNPPLARRWPEAFAQLVQPTEMDGGGQRRTAKKERQRQRVCHGQYLHARQPSCDAADQPAASWLAAQPAQPDDEPTPHQPERSAANNRNQLLRVSEFVGGRPPSNPPASRGTGNPPPRLRGG